MKLQDLIVTYFIRSLMTYFVAPLVAAGITTIDEFKTVEMKSFRRSTGLSTMISNENIMSWTNWVSLKKALQKQVNKLKEEGC